MSAWQAGGGKYRGKRARLRRTASRHYTYLPTLAVGVGGECLYISLRPTACREANLRRKKASTILTCPPPFGGGWRAKRDGRGRLYKMAPHISKGRHIHLPFIIHHLPFLKIPRSPSFTLGNQRIKPGADFFQLRLFLRLHSPVGKGVSIYISRMLPLA